MELAAEIKAQHPGKQVTLIHPSNELVSQSTTEKFQDKLWKILTDMNIDLVLGIISSSTLILAADLVNVFVLDCIGLLTLLLILVNVSHKKIKKSSEIVRKMR